MSSLGPAMKILHRYQLYVKIILSQETIPFTLIWISGDAPSAVAMVVRSKPCLALLFSAVVILTSRLRAVSQC